MKSMVQLSGHNTYTKKNNNNNNIMYTLFFFIFFMCNYDRIVIFKFLNCNTY